MREEVRVASGGRGVYDITAHVERLSRASGAERGIIILYCTDPLCRLITIEYDGDLIEDLMALIDGLKAKNPYVVASIFHPSLVIPFERGLLLGSFQQICLLDLNESAGDRVVVAEVIT
ncbi:MAG: YjbQ family protein [Thermofilaceae archaeon]